MELDIWSGFYKGSNAYYIVEGRNNTAENDNAEVIRVIKYDTNWKRLGAASITGNTALFGGEVRYPFDYGCVEMTEYNGTLYVVTGHEGYVDPTYNQGHQGFLMVAVNESSMQGKIVKCDLWHSFAQYIKNKDSMLYVLEQSEGSRYTKLTRYNAASNLSSSSISVLEYGGDRTSAWAIPCYASVDDIALSDSNVLCLGTSIDQSQYDSYDSNTAYNLYLTVTSMSSFSQSATKVQWLTNYSGNGKRFKGVKLTKANDNRFLVSWEESSSDETVLSDSNDLLSDHTLHYVFIDGTGAKISKEFTVKAAISDCHPILKGSRIVFYSSSPGMVNFYAINANTGAFSKKTYRVLGESVTWSLSGNTLTVSGAGTMTVNNTSYSSLWNPIADKVNMIVVKSGITNIPDNAFTYLSNLTGVKIENGLKTIGKQAFANCNKLKWVAIPASVTSIGEDIVWTGYYWTSDYSHVYRATIYAPSGSVGETYASDNGIRFAEWKEMTNTSTLSAQQIIIGNTVTVNIKADGGVGTRTYAVQYKKEADTKWLTAQSFGSGTSVSIKPAKATGYNICVKSKDETGTIAKVYLTLKVNAKLTNSSTLSASTIQFGSTFTVTAKASGGMGGYTYAVQYKKKADTKWLTKQSFSTNTKIAVKPAKATVYNVCVKVKDKDGTIAKKYFNVTVQ